MAIISIRKLVIIDILYHGKALILVEFISAILCGVGIGLFVLWHPHAPLIGRIVGASALGIGLNYLPLALYAVRHEPAMSAAYPELRTPSEAKRYTLQSFLLLLPCVVLVLAVVQSVRGAE
jgi:hypothetical protein